MEDNYEMVPYKDILELKKDIEELKRGGSSDLLESIKNLTSLINELIAIFKEAAKGMAEDSNESTKNISQKLDEIISQNQKIVEGIVTVAEMLENNIHEKTNTVPFNPMQPPIQPIQQPFPSMPPPPEMSIAQNRQPAQRAFPDIESFNLELPQQPMGMPNFPVEPKKKGLFGRFRK